jgi:hypothetical protein
VNPGAFVVLRRRFPGLVFWFGQRTCSWWALVGPPAGWRLVEAVDAEELTRAVIEAQSWPWPAPDRGARWVLGEPPGAVVVRWWP